MAALVGCVEPRIFTPPLRELTPETSWGFDVAWFAREILHEPLTPWQEWLAIHALELTEDGLPRFKTIVLLVARQNGKTHWAKVLIKWALFRKRLPLVLGVAQTKNDAKDLWEQILTDCENNSGLKKRMRRPCLTNGSEALKTKWGSYRIAALSREAGRGKTVNLLFMDELREHKNWEGWSALSSTTLSPRIGLNVACSNAGDARSVVLKTLRDNACMSIADGNSDVTVGFFEWSAEDDLDIRDREGWRQANPDLGNGRLTERDLTAELEAKTEAEFRTENLCQWVEVLTDGKVTEDMWTGLADETSEIPDGTPIAVGVDVALDGEAAHIAVAARRDDGRVHIEIAATGAGYRWVPHWLAERKATWFSGRVGMQVRGAPSAALVTLMEEAGIEVDPWQGADMSGSTLGYFDALRSGDIVHPGDGSDLLSVSAIGVREKLSGSTFIWSRQESLADATPFVASNIAWWQLTKPEEETFVSAYADDEWGDVQVADDDDYLLIV